MISSVEEHFCPIYRFTVKRAMKLGRLRTSGWPSGKHQLFRQWLRKPLEECVRSTSDEECNNFSTARRYRQDLRQPHLTRLPTLVTYFCGGGEECRDVNSEAAVNTAIDNIDNSYVVVGVVELLEMSLAVLEHRLSQVFKVPSVLGYDCMP